MVLNLQSFFGGENEVALNGKKEKTVQAGKWY